MAVVKGFFILALIACGLASPTGRNEDDFTIYETPESIMAQGYVAERHRVVTEDGYIIEMHRIPFGRYQTSAAGYRPAIFLMHGLLAASSSYLSLGPEYAIGYNLADAGFDVWLGNARGNRLSRHHVSLDPSGDSEKMDFFDFSWEEIGMNDLATAIDYVLETTGQKKLHYVGHSQGGTVFLVLASMKPEYNEKFTSVHLLAGVGYQRFFPNIPLAAAAAITDVIYAAALSQGFVEVFPPDMDISLEDLIPWQYTRADLCTGNLNTRHMCDIIGVRNIIGADQDKEITTLNILESSGAFGGAALKQIAHYGQNIRDRQFRRWNYGLIENIRVYGSLTPPNYDLSLITANVTMHYTISDVLLDERDVLAMAADMPNTVARKVARDSFGHIDFVGAEDVKELVTDYMIDAMLYFEDVEIMDANIEPTEVNAVEYEDSMEVIESNTPDSSSTATLSLILQLYIYLHALYLMTN